MRLSNLHALPSSLLLISASFLTTSTLAQSEGVRSTTTDDGLTIQYTNELTCLRPTKKGDEIMVHYRGTLESNGNEFDSSFGRGAPFSFYLGKGQVIKGWDEGLLDMCAGENRTLIIPPELGYGNRAIGPIPKGSTLIFETSLVGVIGVPKEDIEGHAIEPAVAVPVEDDKEQQEEPAFPDADITPVDFNSIPPVEGEENDANLNDNLDALPSISSDEEQAPPKAEDVEEVEEVEEVEDVEKAQNTDDDEQVEDLLSADDNGPMAGILTLKKNECRLLGPFALVVQGALGLLALLSLVFKRWRERPRRALKVWFFDCSKQILGTFLLHLANLAMSMFSSGSFDVQARDGRVSDAAKHGRHGDQPNPCSFYLLNLAIDTTIGIPVLVVLLKVFHALFLRTALANPPESIKSGHYGTPARWTWWLKQSLIYFLGLIGMKIFVLFIFAALPWIGWVGDWALRWTEGNEALQIAFVMFIFPVLMNAIQYYVVDSFIKENKGPEIDREGFRRVNTDDSEHGSYHSREDDDEEEEDVVAEVIDEQVVKKTANAKAREADLQEINPTPLPAYEDEGSGSSIDEARK